MIEHADDLQYIEDPHTAARAYLELKNQATNRAHTPGMRKRSTQLMGQLVKTWPEAPHVAAAAADHELDLNPELRRTRDEHRADVGVTAHDAAKARRKPEHAGKKPTRAQRAKAHARSAAGAADARIAAGTRSATRSASRGLAMTGLPAAGQSWGRLTLQMLGWGLGLSMLYLLLHNSARAPRGQAAVELLAGGVTTAVTALVNPLSDPLSPRRQPPPPRKTTTVARRPATTTRTQRRQEAHR